ncbi:uncharacterized protein K02A2.6-like [Armigeres subalbatus]|uniref:uncharacterized protein K02A2.6-like n=1 Tax=Armigeres subalbatus TaxID=124917 RepID=UPI002ED0AC2A
MAEEEEKKQVIAGSSGTNRVANNFGSFDNYVAGDDFEVYEERMVQHFLLHDVPRNRKVPFLLTHLGMDTYAILKKILQPVNPSSKTYPELVTALKKHFRPDVNKISERYRFHQADQKAGQTMSEYVVELKALAEKCEFDNFLTEALRDRFVFGIYDSKLRTHLLKQKKMSFENALDESLNWELAEKDNKVRENVLGAHVVRHGKQNRNRSKSRSRFTNSNGGQKNQYGRRKVCEKCGRDHEQGKCPARSWKCFACGKQGHAANMCYSRGSKQTRSGSQDSRKSQTVGTVGGADDLVTEIANLRMQLNTVASDKLLEKSKEWGLCLYRKWFSDRPLFEISDGFSTVTGQGIQVIGGFNAEVSSSQRGPSRKLALVVIESGKAFRPLLGRTWLDVLWPGWRRKFKESIVSMNSVDCTLIDSIRSKFPNVICDDNSPIRDFEAEIIMEDNVQPIFHAAYSPPFQQRPAIEAELNRLCEENVLRKVVFSKWASPIVVVPKANGSLRLCIDCKVTINPYLRSEYYPLPRIDDIFAKLGNSKFFCVIDLRGAYQQLKVSENSQQFLTINTHIGLFQYLRLPFGVATAPSIFQSIMDQILGDIDGCVTYLDDALLGARTLDECRKLLDQVLERLSRFNVKINTEKCKFFVTSVDYLGHTISKDGIRPNQSKVDAIVNAPAPKNISELQSYLGLLNYYSKFIPNISSELRVLYRLLRKDVPFSWNRDCEECFVRSKQLMVKNNLLQLYDSSKPIVVAADASPYGVGAVLSHVVDGEEKPVIFASCTLSPAEKNYSQLHREALAIIFAVKRFHKYIYGHRFKLVSDCEALKEIYHPRKGTSVISASRLQRWAVILSMYDYEWEYRPSRKMAHADALSRLPVLGGTEIDESSINSLEQYPELPLKTSDVADLTAKDNILSQVYDFVQFQWPQIIPDRLKYYYNLPKVMNGTNAEKVNEQLDDFFKFVGLPEQIVSDNGPPFSSFEFVRYWESLNVKIMKSPVYHPQSNGAAERGVQTVKSFSKKRLLEQQGGRKTLTKRLNEILAWYNSTPCTVTRKSPNTYK